MLALLGLSALFLVTSRLAVVGFLLIFRRKFRYEWIRFAIGFLATRLGVLQFPAVGLVVFQQRGVAEALLLVLLVVLRDLFVGDLGELRFEGLKISLQEGDVHLSRLAEARMTTAVLVGGQRLILVEESTQLDLARRFDVFHEGVDRNGGHVELLLDVQFLIHLPIPLGRRQHTRSRHLHGQQRLQLVSQDVVQGGTAQPQVLADLLELLVIELVSRDLLDMRNDGLIGDNDSHLFGFVAEQVSQDHVPVDLLGRVAEPERGWLHVRAPARMLISFPHELVRNLTACDEVREIPFGEVPDAGLDGRRRPAQTLRGEAQRDAEERPGDGVLGRLSDSHPDDPQDAGAHTDERQEHHRRRQPAGP